MGFTDLKQLRQTDGLGSLFNQSPILSVFVQFLAETFPLSPFSSLVFRNFPAMPFILSSALSNGPLSLTVRMLLL